MFDFEVCLGELLSTIFEGPATTSTFVIICFCSFITDFGTFISLFGGEDIMDMALDAITGIEALLVLTLSDILLGFIVSGFTSVTDGGGGLVSIMFSCTGFSVFGGSEK